MSEVEARITRLSKRWNLKIGDTVCHHEGEFLGPILSFELQPIRSRGNNKNRLMLMVIVAEGRYYVGDVAQVPSPEEIRIRAAECREQHNLRRLNETGGKYDRVRS